MLTVTEEMTIAGSADTAGLVLMPPRPNGRQDGRKFFDGLPDSEQDKLDALLGRLAERGEITNDQDLKFLTSGANRIFELKTNLNRLYGFHHDALSTARRQPVFCVTTGGPKRSRAATKKVKQDYERAETLRNELL